MTTCSNLQKQKENIQTINQKGTTSQKEEKTYLDLLLDVCGIKCRSCLGKNSWFGNNFQCISCHDRYCQYKKRTGCTLGSTAFFLVCGSSSCGIDETMSPVANESNDMGNPDTFSQKVFSSIPFLLLAVVLVSRRNNACVKVPHSLTHKFLRALGW